MAKRPTLTRDHALFVFGLLADRSGGNRTPVADNGAPYVQRIVLDAATAMVALESFLDQHRRHRDAASRERRQ